MLQLKKFFLFLFTKLLQLNLYDTKSDDRIVTRRQILSTRLFLLLFISTASILTIYTAFSVQIKIEVVNSATLSDYYELQEKYPDTLQCPCKKISIPYVDFLKIVPSFHQVCSSGFVSQSWIDFTFHINRSLLWPMDVRTSVSAMWQLIAALCRQSIDIFVNALDDFRDLPLVSANLLSPILLDSKTQAALSLLRQTATENLAGPLKAVYSISVVSDYMTGVATNYIAIGALPPQGQGMYTWIGTSSVGYIREGSTDVCYCQQKASCSLAGGIYLSDVWETHAIYDLNNITPSHILPGLVVDCLPMQMVFGSTLQCFYNQSCLSLLLSSYRSFFEGATLDSQIQSRFTPTTLIETMIEELFIEQLLNYNNYSSYYLSCSPTSCSYTYARRFDWVYVVATLVTLLGGLNGAFQMISPYLIHLLLFVKLKLSSTSTGTQSKQNQAGTFSPKRLLSLALRSTMSINLFSEQSRDPMEIRRGQYASRLYFVIFTVGVTILVIYYSATMRIFQQTIPSPTQAHYESLQQQYPTTLQCPCSTVSVIYEDIIRIDPSFHQICSSDFVQSRWYESFGLREFDVEFSTYHIGINGRFRMLATFCEIANVTSRESIRRFYANSFVKAYMVPSAMFSVEMDSIIFAFLNSTLNEFSYIRALINAVLQANQYIRGAAAQNSLLMITDFSGYLRPDNEPIRISTADIGITQNRIENCFCARSELCNNVDLVSMLGTCSSMVSALNQLLSDFYSVTWLNSLINPFLMRNTSFPHNTTLLDPSLPSRFSLNSTLLSVIDQLMVEQWNPKISFSDFYRKCQPMYCSFIYQAKPNFFFVIGLVVGIVSGMNQLLRLICPLFLKIIIRRRAIEHSTNPEHHSFSIFIWVRESFLTFNLFDTNSVQIPNLSQQRTSTWFYVTMLTTCLIAVCVYTALITESTTTRVTIASFEDYEHLGSSNLTNLQCPCSQIAVSYREFITVTSSSHQICASDFVQDPWIDFLFSEGLWHFYHRLDIRIRGAASFAFLASLCRLSKTTIDNSIDQFLNETFINNQMISKFEFQSNMNNILDQFKRNTPAKFSSLVQLLSSITHANTLISTYLLNWNWAPPIDYNQRQLHTRAIVLDDGCSCGTRNDCKTTAGIYAFLRNPALWTIPGFYIGCSSMETLFLSTLECFYDENCMNQLMNHTTQVTYSLGRPIEIRILNSTIPSHFQSNTTIRDLANVLFVEEWSSNTSYYSFYHQCAPIYCSYKINQHNDIILIFSRMLGLYGGLSVGLTFLTPHIVSLAMKIKNSFRPTTVMSYEN